jgi:hypothetical protein
MSASGASSHIGELLGDDVIIYRAFSDRSYRHRKRNKVRSGAYLLREDEVGDGLSVGLTPKDAVKFLSTNYGYCSIAVGIVHGLPFSLKVRADKSDPGHAFICNLPLVTFSDRHREEAMLVAGELARRSKVETCDTYVPNGCPQPSDD